MKATVSVNNAKMATNYNFGKKPVKALTRIFVWLRILSRLSVWIVRINTLQSFGTIDQFVLMIGIIP